MECAGFAYSSQRVQRGNRLPRLPKAKLEVSTSPLSKFTNSLQSPPVYEFRNISSDVVMFSIIRYKELLVYF